MIEPLGDRVLIKPDPMEGVSVETGTTKGGIIIPQTAQEKFFPMSGTVIDIGPDVQDIDIEDKVIFDKFTGIDYTYEGEKLTFMHESELIGRITP